MAQKKLFRGVLLLGCLALCSGTADAQSQMIRDMVNSVSLDSLVFSVKVLSGEVGSQSGGTGDTIRSRAVSEPGNLLASSYLRQRLLGLGLPVQLHEYSDPLGNTEVNVLAQQTGELYPLQRYILSAHFDATSDSEQVAPGADDNASGCAAVLEAARLLSRYRTAYTVIYAFWNEEELGTIGSDRYAREARARGDSILGVLNCEMFGWDGNNDSLMEAHSAVVAHSNELADTVAQVDSLYRLGLKTSVRIPGVGGSDHSSFGRQKYSAVTISQALSDFSPVNHKRTDRLERFNLSYFHRNARLATATIAFLSGIQGPLAVRPGQLMPERFSLEQNYPNPFNPKTRIGFSLPARSYATLTVFNALGQVLGRLIDGEMAAGSHQVEFNATNLSTGVYFYRLQAGGQVLTQRMALVR